MYKYWMSKYNSYKRFTKNNKKSIFYKDKNIMILPESYKNKTKIDIELKVQTNKNYFYIKIMCSISVRQNGGILNLNVTLNGQNSNGFIIHNWADNQSDKP